MRKRILLAEQHRRRGLDANVSIAAYLEKMEVNTRLCLTGSQLTSNLIRFKPHVVYYPWVTPYVYNFLRYREQGVPIVNAFQEQNTVLYRPNAPMVRWASKSDYIFAWGEAQKKKIEDLFGEVNVVLTGNPRFDPYFAPEIAKSLYPDRKKLAKRHSLPSEKRWVLLALDFPLVFKSKDNLKKLVERGDLTHERIQIVQAVFRKIRSWMRRLVSEKNNQSVIIVRPHPGTNLRKIKKEFGGETESIRYIKGGGLPPWILSVDSYTTRASTSITEAWLADVPTALIQRNKHIKDGKARPHILEADTSLDLYSEFRDFIINGVRRGSRNLHHSFLSSHYRLDGRSGKRTAEKLKEIVCRQKKEPEYQTTIIEDTVENIKYELKKLINQSGFNNWNPFSRPNGEFLSQNKSQKRVKTFRKNI